MNLRSFRRRQQGNILVGLIILVVAAVIIIKLVQFCEKVFPPCPAPPAGSTNGTTNDPGSSYTSTGPWLQFDLVQDTGNVEAVNPNPHFVLWGMVSTHIPDQVPPYGDSVAYLQEVSPDKGATLDLAQLGQSFQSWGFTVDGAWLSNTVANPGSWSQYSLGVARSQWDWLGGTASRQKKWGWNVQPTFEPYGGQICVDVLMAPDVWHTASLERSTDFTNWQVVATGQFMKGLFNLYIDPVPGTAFYRVCVAPPAVVSVVKH